MKKNKYLKYLLVFILVFSVTFLMNYFLIYDLEYHINSKQITYTEFTVADTYVSENGHHNFIIVSNTNKSYEIFNDDDGVDIYNRIEKGHHYHFVIRNDSDCEYPHIIQVYNERK